MSKAKRPHIFVAIASYRDPECQHTVKNLFDRAKHPERITVGICWQFDPKEDADCFIVPYPRPKQVREKKVHYSESRGSCWARAEALALLEDEEYVLMIDAHMRFVEDWDERMIDTRSRCATPRALLTTVPLSYTPPDKLQSDAEGIAFTVVRGVGTADDLQPVVLNGVVWPKSYPQKLGGPLPGAFIVANFLFGPAEAFREAPYDPHIYFRGQEAVYSARLFTHGWDIYQPDLTLIYHYWDSKTRGTGGGEDDYKKKNQRALLAQKRVRHLLGVEFTRERAALVEIEKYGMGITRPLADFWPFSGVNLRTGEYAGKAHDGTWRTYQKPKEPPAESFSLSASMQTTSSMNLKTGTSIQGEEG